MGTLIGRARQLAILTSRLTIMLVVWTVRLTVMAMAAIATFMLSRTR